MSALRELRLADVARRIWATRTGRQWVVAVQVEDLWVRGYGRTYDAALSSALGLDGSIN